MARPTKYKKEYCDKIEDYVAECIAKSKQSEDEVFLPTVEGASLLLDVNRETLYNWKEKHDEFLDTFEKIEKTQKQMLIENGLSGDYNSTIAKLMLSSNHGMKERQDVTSGDEKMVDGIQVEVVNSKDEQTEPESD